MIFCVLFVWSLWYVNIADGDECDWFYCNTEIFKSQLNFLMYFVFIICIYCVLYDLSFIFSLSLMVLNKGYVILCIYW